jgi:hypothetical protein
LELDAHRELFLGLMFFNLWFTANRLRSSARIAAYLQLVHEPDPKLPWVGWETALLRYRAVTHNEEKHGAVCSTEATAGEKGPGPTQTNNAAFYEPILWFHLLAGIAIAVMLILAARPIPGSMSNVTTGLSAVSTALFAVMSLWAFGAKDIRQRIAVERDTWRRVFETTQPSVD